MSTNNAGFGETNNQTITGLNAFGKHLYASVRNDSFGAGVWRASTDTLAPSATTINACQSGEKPASVQTNGVHAPAPASLLPLLMWWTAPAPSNAVP